MKLVLVGIFIAFFVVLPMYALDALVMPQLQALQQTYSHVDDLANSVAAQPGAR